METPCLPPNVTVIQCRSLLHLFTTIRNKDTTPEQFAHTAKRLMYIISEVLYFSIHNMWRPIKPLNSQLLRRKHSRRRPGPCFLGEVVDTSNIVAVSIIRAGDSLLGRLKTIIIVFDLVVSLYMT